ncbi:MAG: hypothetical protein NVSMB44_14850 [Ktedonobacteraceae bacterium]
MFLTVYITFKYNFAGFASKITFERSLKIRDEPLFCSALALILCKGYTPFDGCCGHTISGKMWNAL